LADDSDNENRGTPDPATWVDRYGNDLYRYAYARLRDVHATEEAVQDTLLAGVQHIQQLRDLRKEKSWLLSILSRKIVDLIRRRNRQKRLDAMVHNDPLVEQFLDTFGAVDVSLVPIKLDPSTLAQHNELRSIIVECLKVLPQKQADAFTLRELEELGAEEICETLQISKSNLWVLLHRARIRIAECLLEHFDKDSLDDRSEK